MDNIPKFLVSLVLIMVAVIIGVSLVITNFYIGSVRSYQDQVTKALSGADFTESQIEELKADASSKGYVLEVNQTLNKHIYKVDLSYTIKVPIFGTLDSNKLTSYAMNYAALAESSINSPLDAPVISMIDKGVGKKNENLDMSLLKIEKVDEAERYLVFVDGEARLNILESDLAASDRIIDLYEALEEIIPAETPVKYVITAKACATRACNDSPFSNSVVFVANCQHDYKVTQIVHPTCTTVGYTMYSCWICEDVCRDDEVPALGHDYTKEIVSEDYLRSAATCTEDATYYYACSRCDVSSEGESKVWFTDKGSALGHDYTDWAVTVVPTCTTLGEERRGCQREGCDHYETREVAIDPDNHNYVPVVTAPTCTEEGYTTHTCSRCGDAYKDTYVDALEHDWDDGVVTNTPTCAGTGTKLFTCDRCGATREDVLDVNPDAHDYVSTVTAPTCTDQGYTTYTCSRCPSSYKDDYVDALGHAPATTVEWNGDHTKATVSCTRDCGTTWSSSEITRNTTTTANCTVKEKYNHTVTINVNGEEKSFTCGGHTGDALGHNPNATVMWASGCKSATVICLREGCNQTWSSSTVTRNTTTPATCTVKEKYNHTVMINVDGTDKTFTCGGHPGDALGHAPATTVTWDTDHTEATVICTRDGCTTTWSSSDITRNTTTYANCTVKEKYDHTVTINVDGEEKSFTCGGHTGSALGHNPNSTVTWASGCKSATVKCLREGCNQTWSSDTVTRNTTTYANCTVKEKYNHTVTINVNGTNKTFTCTGHTGSALGHAPAATATWSNGCASASVKCTRTGCSQTWSADNESERTTRSATCTVVRQYDHQITINVNGTSKTFYCGNTHESSALGHDPATTATWTGCSSASVKCTRCSQTWSGNASENTTRSATCTGTRQYNHKATFSVNGTSKTFYCGNTHESSALGHNYTGSYSSYSSTQHRRKCSRCETYEYVAHTYDQTTTSSTYLANAATCHAPALYYKHCSCGYNPQSLSTGDSFYAGSKASHTSSGWLTERAASAEYCGLQVKRCTVCGVLMNTQVVNATNNKSSTTRGGVTATYTTADITRDQLKNGITLDFKNYTLPNSYQERVALRKNIKTDDLNNIGKYRELDGYDRFFVLNPGEGLEVIHQGTDSAGKQLFQVGDTVYITFTFYHTSGWGQNTYLYAGNTQVDGNPFRYYPSSTGGNAHIFGAGAYSTTSVYTVTADNIDFSCFWLYGSVTVTEYVASITIEVIPDKVQTMGYDWVDLSPAIPNIEQLKAGYDWNNLEDLVFGASGKYTVGSVGGTSGPALSAAGYSSGQRVIVVPKGTHLLKGFNRGSFFTPGYRYTVELAYYSYSSTGAFVEYDEITHDEITNEVEHSGNHNISNYNIAQGYHELTFTFIPHGSGAYSNMTQPGIAIYDLNGELHIVKFKITLETPDTMLHATPAESTGLKTYSFAAGSVPALSTPVVGGCGNACCRVESGRFIDLYAIDAFYKPYNTTSGSSADSYHINNPYIDDYTAARLLYTGNGFNRYAYHVSHTNAVLDFTKGQFTAGKTYEITMRVYMVEMGEGGASAMALLTCKSNGVQVGDANYVQYYRVKGASENTYDIKATITIPSGTDHLEFYYATEEDFYIAGITVTQK